MLKAVLFDFDGVIVDGISINDGCYIDTFKKVGIDIDLNHLHTKIGMTTGQVIRSMLEDHKLDIDPTYVEKMMQTNIIGYYKHLAVLPPHLVEFLKDIKKRNLKTGIASGSHSKAILAVLNKFNLKDYFDVIIGGEMVKRGKPDPELWLKLLEALGVDPKDAVAIDDARAGIIAAKEISVETIAYSGFTREIIEIADLNISDFKDINLNDYLKQPSST